MVYGEIPSPVNEDWKEAIMPYAVGFAYRFGSDGVKGRG